MKSFYNTVKNNGYGLTLDECIECVRFRVICETYNGIIIGKAIVLSIPEDRYSRGVAIMHYRLLDIYKTMKSE